MKKSNLYLLIDIMMFIFLAFMTGIGLLIKFVLVPGSKRWDIYGRNVDLTYLGMDRHGWGTLHFIFSILFISALVLHIILHWKSLIAYMKKIINTKVEINLLVIAFGFILLFLVILPFIINVKVTELGDGRDRILHGTQGQHIPAAVQREQMETQQVIPEKERPIIKEVIKSEEEEAGLEHHDIDSDIEVLGSMSLINVSIKYNVPVSHILQELDLPANVSGNERLGRLRRTYGFTMSDIELIIHNYRHK